MKESVMEEQVQAGKFLEALTLVLRGDVYYYCGIRKQESRPQQRKGAAGLCQL